MYLYNTLHLCILELGASLAKEKEETKQYPEIQSSIEPEIQSVHPEVTVAGLANSKIRVKFNANVEADDSIAFNIYRDGILQETGKDLPGSTTQWIDPDSSALSPSYCYTIESYFLTSKNFSQRSAPAYYWGEHGEQVVKIPVDEFKAVGGDLNTNSENHYYEHWENRHDSLILKTFIPPSSGQYLFQVIAANSSGPINTGITCAVKHIEIQEQGSETVVVSGQLMVPQSGSWIYDRVRLL